MIDLISRQAAIDAIRSFYDEYTVYDNEKSIEELISELPSVETNHGKWIKLYYRNYKCSCCGAWWTLDRDSTIKDFDYCPACGARMDGE